MNVPGQDVPGNLQDLMSSQGSVLLLKKCGIMLQHLCLDNFNKMQFRQTTWFLLENYFRNQNLAIYLDF